eukprot:GFUD01137545.1.p1 GENE.GFUD01137545.1~~GFUD01137545.1.p1  ORF type:complete len:282 (+),score=70.92 GFUD01137545.1:58-903(+)
MENMILDWEGHQEFSSTILKNLLFDENSSNVTLVSEDNKSVHAHRFVLNYASSFFKEILKNNPEKHLTLHLQGLKYETMINLVKYIYLGQAIVRKEEWEDFLTNATKWNIVKLAESNNSEVSEPSETKPETDCDNEELLREQSDLSEQSDDLLKVVKKEISTDTVDEIDSNDDKPLKSEQSIPLEKSIPIEKKFNKIRFECDLCQKDFSNISDLIQHKKDHISNTEVLKSEHQEDDYATNQTPKSSAHEHYCDLCDYKCSRPSRLKTHKRSKHGISDDISQ